VRRRGAARAASARDAGGATGSAGSSSPECRAARTGCPARTARGACAVSAAIAFVRFFSAATAAALIPGNSRKTACAAPACQAGRATASAAISFPGYCAARAGRSARDNAVAAVIPFIRLRSSAASARIRGSTRKTARAPCAPAGAAEPSV